MNGYDIADDGKIHTHFSELMRCTPFQMHSVLNDRLGLKKRFTSPAMDFGHERHDMFEEEAKKTGLTPEVFKADSANFQCKAEMVEQELATEIFPGVILHSRLDCYGEGNVIDYKTTTMGYHKATQTYNRSIQLKIYAYHAMLHDIPVKKMIYLIEQWEHEYTGVKGYFKVEKELTPKHISEAQKWLKRRCEALIIGLEEFGDPKKS